MRELAELLSQDDEIWSPAVVGAGAILLAACVSMAAAACGMCGGQASHAEYTDGSYVPPSQPQMPSHPSHRSRPPEPQPLPEDAPVRVEMQSPTAEGLVTFLKEAHCLAGGRLPQDCQLDESSIRIGQHAAIADVRNQYGLDATVLFFAKEEKCKLHLSIHKICSDFTPSLVPVVIRGREEASVGPQDQQLPGMRAVIAVPRHVRVDKCTPLTDELSRTIAPYTDPHRAENARLQQLFQIVLQLTSFLKHAHDNRVVLRDVRLGNVVFAQLHNQRGWTLLEFSTAAKLGAMSSSVPPRRTPPELAVDLATNRRVPMQPSYDMWQLGMLLYELSSQELPAAVARGGSVAPPTKFRYKPSAPYWPRPPAVTDRDVLSRLQAYAVDAENRELMPHEANPLANETLRAIVEGLLAPNEASRWSAEQLRMFVENNTSSVTMLGQGEAAETQSS